MAQDGEKSRLKAAEEREPTDTDLLERIRVGDEEAFPLLFDRYVKVLRSYARKWLPGRLRRKVSVADVLQEARFTAFRKRLEFEHRGGKSLRNWLLRIVEFKVKEAVRHHVETEQRAVGREVSRGYRPETGQMLSPGPSPSEVAQANELSVLASRAMLTLPEHYREVLRMARREGMSFREIAESIGKNREAVKKLYARALSRFTAEFKRLRGESHG